MREIHRHLDAETLEEYSMGAIPPEGIAAIEEHLLICESCQNLLGETDRYRLAMRMASEQVRSDERTVPRHGWGLPSWFPAFAAAACGLLLAVVIALSFMRSPGPVVAISLTALRNNGSGASAPAGRELVLHPDLTGLAESSSYRLEIVDQAGRPVRKATLSQAQSGIKVTGLRAGVYFVRLYLPAGELLREYGLQID